MFVRVAQFEESDPETRAARLEQMQREIEAVKAGDVPEGVPPEAAAALRSSVSRVLGLADLRGGGEANAVFCETEDDLRRADEILNAMTPPEGDGRRTDVAHYEVLLDVEF